MNGSYTPTTSRAVGADAWYRSAFDRLYPLIYRHRDAASASQEIADLLKVLDQMGIDPPRRVLDIACGAGRHMVAMLDAGLDAFGIDLSAALLDRARQHDALGGRLARADVRALPFAGAFDLALNLFTSFGYFETDVENAAALRQMAATLKPDGWLVMDHANRAYVETNLITADEQQVDDLVVRSRRTIEGQRVVKRMVITDASGHAEYLTESVRLFTPAQITGMFEQAGLTVERMIGSFDGDVLTEQSARMIVIGKRR